MVLTLPDGPCVAARHRIEGGVKAYDSTGLLTLSNPVLYHAVHPLSYVCTSQTSQQVSLCVRYLFSRWIDRRTHHARHAAAASPQSSARHGPNPRDDPRRRPAGAPYKRNRPGRLYKLSSGAVSKEIRFLYVNVSSKYIINNTQTSHATAQKSHDDTWSATKGV